MERVRDWNGGRLALSGSTTKQHPLPSHSRADARAGERKNTERVEKTVLLASYPVPPHTTGYEVFTFRRLFLCPAMRVSNVLGLG